MPCFPANPTVVDNRKPQGRKPLKPSALIANTLDVSHRVTDAALTVPPLSGAALRHHQQLSILAAGEMSIKLRNEVRGGAGPTPTSHGLATKAMEPGPVVTAAAPLPQREPKKRDGAKLPSALVSASNVHTAGLSDADHRPKM